jgi:hypothetical protein
MVSCLLLLPDWWNFRVLDWACLSCRCWNWWVCMGLWPCHFPSVVTTIRDVMEQLKLVNMAFSHVWHTLWCVFKHVAIFCQLQLDNPKKGIYIQRRNKYFALHFVNFPFHLNTFIQLTSLKFNYEKNDNSQIILFTIRLPSI